MTRTDRGPWALAAARAISRLKLRPVDCATRDERLIVDPTGGADAPSWRGETALQRVAFACAAFMLLASPAAAQQTVPGQSAPAQTSSDQTAPVQAPQTDSQLPPPFVPPPPARFYGDRPSRTHHHAATHRKAARRATGRYHAAAPRHKTRKSHATAHASKRVIRQCHKMTYNEIIRHSSCRALMKRELETPERAHRHAPKHHRASTRHHGSKHRHRG